MLKKSPYKSFLVVIGLLALLSGGSAAAQKDSPHSGPVMNYHRVNDRLVTGGHLLDGGSADLKEQGVKVVIDLRDDSPSGEQKRFAEQGIEWINIPVEWRDPKKADFDRFSETMREHQGDHVLVQCAGNYRASAMTYLYRVVVENVPEYLFLKVGSLDDASWVTPQMHIYTAAKQPWVQINDGLPQYEKEPEEE